MDFTIKKYIELLKVLKQSNRKFLTVNEYDKRLAHERNVFLRHDVDRLPKNSLLFAEIQNSMGIIGTYYFRILRCSFNEDIILKIASLGHEIGYHYEDIDLAKGNLNYAMKLFLSNLKTLRKYYPVNTICMHGSPLSKYDNKLLWEYNNYKELGIIIEPYIDIDFSEILYITDTGRKWNGDSVSIRDKVYQGYGETKRKPLSKYFNFNSTQDIIKSINDDKFPDSAMITFHPQRWAVNNFQWVMEVIAQNSKNQIKRMILKTKK